MTKIWEQWAELSVDDGETTSIVQMTESLYCVHGIFAMKFSKTIPFSFYANCFVNCLLFAFYFPNALICILSDINDQLDARSVRFKFYKWNKKNWIWIPVRVSEWVCTRIMTLISFRCFLFGIPICLGLPKIKANWVRFNHLAIQFFWRWMEFNCYKKVFAFFCCSIDKSLLNTMKCQSPDTDNFCVYVDLFFAFVVSVCVCRVVEKISNEKIKIIISIMNCTHIYKPTFARDIHSIDLN